MANQVQLEILKQGAGVWNKWRIEHPDERIDLNGAFLMEASLSEANLSGAFLSEADLWAANLSSANLSLANLTGADLRKSDLRKADLSGADFREADLGGANLQEVDLRKANLVKTDLSRASLWNADLREAYIWQADLTGAGLRNADLREVVLEGAKLSYADLTEADLTGANLIQAQLIGTNVSRAKISGSSVYGINVWDLKGEFEEKHDLIITKKDQPLVTVDSLEVAQFVYLVLNNKKLRDVIDTITSKSVLILGRFAVPERKEVLDALRNKLREYKLVPIVFDFDRPTNRDFTETIKILAGLSYFVIADVTNPKSSPLELQATVPDYQIPFVPIIQEGEEPFAMMVDLQKKYPWVLDTLSYDSIETLSKALKQEIIDPAIQKHNELRLTKAQGPKIRSARDLIDDKGLDAQSNALG